MNIKNDFFAQLIRIFSVVQAKYFATPANSLPSDIRVAQKLSRKLGLQLQYIR
jgi:hypothetical protein